MTARITPLVVGNWKMNGTSATLPEVQQLATLIATGEAPRCMVVVCPPATLLQQVTAIAAPGGIVTGGQDCHPAASGAYTGDLSAQMLADAGAQYVIVGHSERRVTHGETDALVVQKAQAAMACGLVPIICIGETAEERDRGEAAEVVRRQLQDSVPEEWAGQGVVIAYEPVWAIGTGLTPTAADIGEMHTMIRAELAKRFGDRGAATRILYGGSMKPTNARDIMRMDNVDGGLVGGASLLANDFYTIISAV